ncbi:hypothetical protein HPB48_021132 [Haemaphysalis longicornis]|uniref:Uncharacterized protein n=1 Tax=Haemaphysalis longicornis TaxID=44386 RepID=A0A9J6FXL8_HAELO|nr:hypothetical protein HPB48_021132 [Haemaphysalis longicornis]
MPGWENISKIGVAATSKGCDAPHNEQPESSKGLLFNATEACYGSGELPLEAAHVGSQGAWKFANAAAFSNSLRGWLRCPCHQGTCDVRQLLFADYEATVRTATLELTRNPSYKLIYVLDIPACS